MILAIGTPAANNPISVPNLTTSGDALPDAPSPADSDTLQAADELTLSEPESLPTNDATYQRTSLNLRGHSQVKVRDDGDVRTMSQTKLRFRYEFEAADGTSIQIRLKANLNYSQTADSQDESQTRLRATTRISILQENVSSGVAPLLESPDIAAEAKEFISQAMDLFQQVVGATTSAFLDSDPMDGDSLIAGSVEAYNELAAAIDATFLSPPADPEAVPSDDIIELPVPNDDMLPIEDESVATDENQPVAPATNQPSTSDVGSVMLRVRLQVIQSLSSLVDAFDSGESSVQASQSHFRASAQMTFHSSFSSSNVNGATAIANSIDTQV